ncbi:MAG: right-handed parallel beta-helix repeat-containing protein [Armatimonadetes bacterium]|nr:right-handed parallel beta-helix repeat-containing protein [Armatimonadota bacterium]
MSHRSSLLILLALPALAAAAPEELYVSPTGSDRSAGTAARPFGNVQHARDAARARLARGAEAVRIILHTGIYRLDQPLRLGSEDSGETWIAFRGEQPVLSGGVPVAGWQPDAGGRFEARVDLDNFRQLWVNGHRAQRARGPVPAGLKPWGEDKAELINATNPPGTTGTTGFVPQKLGRIEPAGYTVPDAALADWRNPTDMEFGYYNSWTHSIARFAGITRAADGARITMAQPGFFLCRRKAGAPAGLPSYFENALELLDQPGEWYFDRPAHTLYYLPREGEDMAKAEVIAPRLEMLVEVRGTLDRPAHDIRFEGLTFAHATWLRPCTDFGHPDVQANFIAWPENSYARPEHEHGWTPVNGEAVRSPANLLVDAAQRVTFAGCTFTALGGAGLDLQNGAQDNLVSRCRFQDISASGIQIGDVTRQDHHPDDPRRTVKGNRVEDCTITQIGVEYTDAIGVFYGYTEGTVIAHNEVFGIPYTAISGGWGWGMPDAGGGGYVSPVIYATPTTCRDNVIEYNHLHDLMRVRNDGGGVYTLSRQPGTVVRYNHIHDAGPGGPGGLYTDEGSSEIEVTGNVVHDVPSFLAQNNHAQNRVATCSYHDNFFGLLRTVPGIVGKALAGGSSGIDIPDPGNLDPPQLTVEAWIRLKDFPTGNDARRWVACKMPNEWVDGNYSLFIDGRKVSAYLNLGGGGDANFYRADAKEETLQPDTWTPVAMTYDGETLRAYCDGQETASLRIGRPRAAHPGPLTFGARNDRFCTFPGDLDEVRLYARALSPEELRSNIAAVRAAGGGEPEVVKDGLVGRWGFEEVAGTGEAERIIAEAGPRPEGGHSAG